MGKSRYRFAFFLCGGMGFVDVRWFLMNCFRIKLMSGILRASLHFPDVATFNAAALICLEWVWALGLVSLVARGIKSISDRASGRVR